MKLCFYLIIELWILVVMRDHSISICGKDRACGFSIDALQKKESESPLLTRCYSTTYIQRQCVCGGGGGMMAEAAQLPSGACMLKHYVVTPDAPQTVPNSATEGFATSGHSEKLCSSSPLEEILSTKLLALHLTDR